MHRASRAHLRRAVRPSPARAEPHDSTSWLPLPDVDDLPGIDGLDTCADVTEVHSAAPVDEAPAPPSPARARPHDATAWFPLPVPDELPSIDEMLTQSPWEAKPSPARAEPHDAAAWLPLPDLGELELPVIPDGADGDGGPDATDTPAVVGDTAPVAPEEHSPGTPDEIRPAAAATLPAAAPAPVRLRTLRTLRTRLARPRSVVVALLVLVTLVAAGFGIQQIVNAGTSVEVRADGMRVSVDTDAETVGALLRERRVLLGEFDRVVPPPATVVRDGMTVTVLRAFPITRDLDGDIQTVFTTYSAPSDYVRRELDAADTLVVRSAPQRLKEQSTIILRTPHAGRLLVDGAEVDYTVPALDVDELLAEYSVELGPEDYVMASSGGPVGRDTRLVDGQEYSVIRVGREIVHVEEPYTLPDERRPDASMPVGETRVEEGAPGVMSVSAEITRLNGEEADRRVISRVPTVMARPTIIHFGTKADPMWDRIADCETGGNWAMQGPMFSGGLGFYNGTWDSFGGRDFAPNAGLATREQEIIVAERLRSTVGIGGWGCAHVLGYVR